MVTEITIQEKAGYSLVVGSGGRESENFVRRREKYIMFRYPEEDQDSHGILSIALEAKKMRCKFIANDGIMIDSFTIYKSDVIISNDN